MEKNRTPNSPDWVDPRDPGRRPEDCQDCREIGRVIEKNESTVARFDEKFNELKTLLVSTSDTFLRAAERLEDKLYKALEDHIKNLDDKTEDQRGNMKDLFDAELKAVRTSIKWNYLVSALVISVVFSGFGGGVYLTRLMLGANEQIVTVMEDTSEENCKRIDGLSKKIEESVLAFEAKEAAHLGETIQIRNLQKYILEHQFDVMRFLASLRDEGFGPFGPDGKIADPTDLPQVEIQ